MSKVQGKIMRFEHVDLRKHDEHGTLHAKMPPKYPLS